MKQIFLYAILLFATSQSFNAYAFLGPKDFDDCILKSMKGVTSNEAAGFIYESCASKFPKDGVVEGKNNRFKYVDSKGVHVCELHYTGTKMLTGENRSPPYITYKTERLGTQRLILSLPRELTTVKGFTPETFLQRNLEEIDRLCGF